MTETGHRDGGAGDPLSQEPDERVAAAARFREPSAAERAREQGRLARRKRARLDRKYAAAMGERPHRAVVRAALTLLLFAGVLGAAGGVLYVDLTHPAPAGPAGAPASPAARVAASRPAIPPGSFSPAHPFAGSPAGSFADGTAGIVPPAPHAVGRYPAAQVGRAYVMVKEMLAAAHLNPRTLMGGPPTAFARLLTAPERHQFYQYLNRTGVARQGWVRSTRSWVTSFAPGSTRLVTGVIKVHGSMHAVAATVSGGRPVLRIRADYLFVYAVQRPGVPGTGMRVVERDEDWDDFARWDRQTGPLEPWWTPEGGGPAGSRCDVNDGYVHPGFPGSVPDRTRASGKPVNPYDQSVPPRHKGCQPITGT